MHHLEEMLKSYDEQTAQLLSCQLKEPQHSRRGAFQLRGYYVDTRSSGFGLAHLLVSYVSPESRYHLDPAVRQSLEAAFAYLQAYQRPDGCLDLAGCNFASPPDTAFTMNAVLNGWWLLEKHAEPETQWLRAPLIRLLESCAEGIAAGGFHTPNHRWAICACLKSVAKITGREEFSRRADEYLNEGLDINSDGEFAERSAGNYNQVNDDQMIRLYLATGDKRFLEAAEMNLRMMLKYIDPDDSVFTNNSTRQDYGRKVYLDTYYILFKLVGYLLGKKELAAYGEYCYATARRHGRQPNGVEWLLLYNDLDDFGADEPVDAAAFTQYDYHFKESRIARMRQGNLSCTVMDGKANFLYFQNGSMPVYMVIYENLCDKRNFIADKLEKTERGYRLSFHQDSWYYLPFYPDKPETSDWWAMDNPNTRKRCQGVALDTYVDVEMAGDGMDVTIHTEGLDWLPLRVELGFPGGSQLRHESFLMEGKAGESMLLAKGPLEVTAPSGERMVLSQGFAEHSALGRSDRAYPQSPEHFTVYLTAYTPVNKKIHIGANGCFDPDLLSASKN